MYFDGSACQNHRLSTIEIIQSSTRCQIFFFSKGRDKHNQRNRNDSCIVVYSGEIVMSIPHVTTEDSVLLHDFFG